MAATEIAATEGQLEVVCGDKLIVGFNTTRVCMAHTQQALRFSAMLNSRRHPDIEKFGFGAAFGIEMPGASEQKQTGDRLHFGIATGRLLQGTVGTSKQRFRVILGDQEILAHALSEHCPAFSSLALASYRQPLKDPSSSDPHGIEVHLRPVDIWLVGEEKQLVERVDLVMLSRAEREFGVWDFLSGAEAAGMGGGETTQATKATKVKAALPEDALGVPRAYMIHFHEAIQGDRSHLDELWNMAPKSDKPHIQVCERLETRIENDDAGNYYIPPSLVPFWDGKDAKPVGLPMSPSSRNVHTRGNDTEFKGPSSPLSRQTSSAIMQKNAFSVGVVTTSPRQSPKQSPLNRAPAPVKLLDDGGAAEAAQLAAEK